MPEYDFNWQTDYIFAEPLALPHGSRIHASAWYDNSASNRSTRTRRPRCGGASLRIEVVDERNLPHRGAYELIRVTDRQPFTVGFGADTLQGEQLLTLLMPPGLYRIVQPGSTYRARTDFATVLAPAGGLVHYKLVINPTSGQFRGAGCSRRSGRASTSANTQRPTERREFADAQAVASAGGRRHV